MFTAKTTTQPATWLLVLSDINAPRRSARGAFYYVGLMMRAGAPPCYCDLIPPAIIDASSVEELSARCARDSLREIKLLAEQRHSTMRTKIAIDCALCDS